MISGRPKAVLNPASSQVLYKYEHFGRQAARITSPFVDFTTVFHHGLMADGKLDNLPVDDEEGVPAAERK